MNESTHVFEQSNMRKNIGSLKRSFYGALDIDFWRYMVLLNAP